MSTTSEPRTAAGRALLDEAGDLVVAGGSVWEYVRAIEAEAAGAPLNREALAAALEQIVRIVNGPSSQQDRIEHVHAVARAALGPSTASEPETGLREAAQAFATHVSSIGCDHEWTTVGSHTGCSERLALNAALAAALASEPVR